MCLQLALSQYITYWICLYGKYKNLLLNPQSTCVVIKNTQIKRGTTFKNKKAFYFMPQPYSPTALFFNHLRRSVMTPRSLNQSKSLTKSTVLSWAHTCLASDLLFNPKLTRSRTVTQTGLLWWCIFPAGLSSPARSSPPLPPAWRVPAQDWPASAPPSPGPNAALWSGGALVCPRAGRNGACRRSDAAPRPGTWPGGPRGWTRRPGNGRRTS